MSIDLTTATHEIAVVPAADEQPGAGSQTWLVRAIGAALARRGDGRGITTVEYVIGIIAGITLVGVLILALTNPAVQHAIVGLVTHIFGEGNSVKPGKVGG